MSDIDLSVDDRWLYVPCWGTGELKQYDVSDPHDPRETGRCAWAGSSTELRTPPFPSGDWRARRIWWR